MPPRASQRTVLAPTRCCSRSAVLMCILLVGLVIVKDRYERLDALMPALPGRGGPTDIDALPGSGDVAKPSRLNVASPFGAASAPASAPASGTPLAAPPESGQHKPDKEGRPGGAPSNPDQAKGDRERLPASPPADPGQPTRDIEGPLGAAPLDSSSPKQENREGEVEIQEEKLAESEDESWV
eukprot:CAMPEP_0170208162 /NCGR_PEP_ID=MMETSP0116_2-20130129/3663_1 /TAXON_ID=400756 /ORGANISM="Durinskia baltica, Strain CSIRO CS-38" /LENGTH=182 /DNA_ID=CAMNT_0010458629 /DNA_START=1 /DNA_END=545 /DNA_ORIENTATION=+